MHFIKKLHKSHEYYDGNAQLVLGNPKNFFTITIAFIMIFMNVAVVSVNVATAENRENHDAALAATMATTTPVQYKASRNTTTSDQQSPKSEPPQIQQPLPPPSAAAAASVSSSLSSIPMPSRGWPTTITSLASLAVGRQQTNNKENILLVSHNNNNNNNIHFPSEMETDSCKSLTGTWGDVDPNIFYVCDKHTKKPQQIRCPEGKGYFNGLSYSGCMPYDQWPACVAASSASAASPFTNQVLICDSEHMQQPWESVNPNIFYICLQEASEPVLLNCGPGKGFVHATAEPAAGGVIITAPTPFRASEIVGCANWEKWRSYMKCTDYY